MRPVLRDYRALLLAADLLAAAGLLSLLVNRWPPASPAAWLPLLLLPVAWSGGLFLVGGYTLDPLRPWPVLGYQLLRGVVSGTVVAAGAAALIPRLPLAPAELYLAATGLMLPAALLARLAALRLLPAELLTERYLLVDQGPATAAFWRSLTRVPLPRHVRVLGLLTSPAAGGENGLPDLPSLGEVRELPELALRLGAGAVILGPGPLDDAEVRALTRCEQQGLRVLSPLVVHEEISRRTPLLDQPAATGGGLLEPKRSKYATRLKRVVDVLATLTLLPLGGLLMGLAALAVLLDDGPPVLYRQQRVGREGRRFQLLKIRTMRPDAEQHTGPVWATAGDDRITRAGRWLRAFRLDELPQLVNVLRGEMSLIGPRPERPAFVEQFSGQIPYYTQRLLVRPGLTGWAQVNHTYDRDLEDVYEKLRHDLYYLRHLSFTLDLQILLATVGVVCSRRGAH